CNRRLPRHAKQEIQILICKQFAGLLLPPDGERANHTVLQDERRNHELFAFGFGLCAWNVNPARVLSRIMHHLGLTALGDAADYAFAQTEGFEPNGIRFAANDGNRAEDFPSGFEQKHGAGIRFQDALGVDGDAFQHHVPIERGGNFAPDVGERRHFVGAAFRFVKELGVLQGYAETVRQRCEQGHSGFAKGVLVVEVLQINDANHLVARDNGNADVRFGNLAAAQNVRAELDTALYDIAIDDEGLSRANDVSGKAGSGMWGIIVALPAFDTVRETK